MTKRIVEFLVELMAERLTNCLIGSIVLLIMLICLIAFGWEIVPQLNIGPFQVNPPQRTEIFLSQANPSRQTDISPSPVSYSSILPIETESPQVVFMINECGFSYPVDANRPVELHYGGWAAKTIKDLEDNLEHITVILEVNQVRTYGVRQKIYPVSTLPCKYLPDGYWTYYAVNLGKLSANMHTVKVTYLFDSEISDGYDLFPADGILDRYSYLSPFNYIIDSQVSMPPAP